MSTTRSNLIYNNNATVSEKKQVAKYSGLVERRSPRISKPIESKVFTFNDSDINRRPKRSTSQRIPLDILREYLNESDDDNSSDYEEEQEESIPVPKYEVNIDFDEASAAWRSNKRRKGEGWVYKLNMKTYDNRVAKDNAVKPEVSSVAPSSVALNVAPSSVALNVAPSSVALNVAPSSVASRVKQNRRTKV